MRKLACVLVLAMLPGSVAGQDEGFVPLFDGRTLDGWVNVNCAPDTFGVRDGMIAVTGVPICEIRTPRMYENFVLELEYQHVQPLGNAGVFIWADALPARGQPFLRAIEVQVLDGRNSETYSSHGDVFAIHGAVLTPNRPHPRGAMRSLPSEHRAKGPGEWNHYRITADSGTITLAVNGKDVSGGFDVSPRKGYIALESEGAPVLFRNIRVRELPSRGPLPAAHVASADAGHVALYDGKTLDGWTVPSDAVASWRPHDWRIAYEGTTTGQPLVSTTSYGDVEVIADWRYVDEGRTVAEPLVLPTRTPGPGVTIASVQSAQTRPPGQWNRVVERIERGTRTLTVNGTVVLDRVPLDGRNGSGKIALVPVGGRVEFANVFVKRLDGR